MARGGRGGNKITAIVGTSGDDILSGVGGSFDLIGSQGNDEYYVDDAADVVTEKRNGGTDHVFSYLDYTLSDHIENLTLLGQGNLRGTGNSESNVLTGNSGNNWLTGLDGDDALFGGAGDDNLNGGSGADLLDGGTGTDTAIFQGTSGNYSISRVGADLHVVSASGEVDVLRDIEFLSFDDRVIAVADIGDDPEMQLPVANDDTSAGDEDNSIVIAVLSNDLGQGLSVAAATNGARGAVTISADGTSVIYTPDQDAAGTDLFSYTLRDAAGQTASAMVSVSIAGTNDAPTAVNDSYSAKAGTPLVSAVSVLANDSDVDGDALTVTAYDATTQHGGSVVMNANGTFTYTSAAGFTGTDTFTYTAGDPNGAGDVATVSVHVTDNAAPPYYVTGLIGEDHQRYNYPSPTGSEVTVTYAFLTEFPDYYNADQATQDAFVAFSQQQAQTTRDILAMIESFTGITFIETTVEQAGMTFGLLEGLGGGSAGLPNGDGVGSNAGDVWIDADFAGSVFEPLTYPYHILLHEIGHAVGLVHPDLPAGEENQQYTLMDIQPHPTFGAFPSGLQLYDVAALQYLYGANTSFASGDDVYGFSSFDGLLKTVWDSGGHDVFDLSGASFGVDINLAPGAFSTVAATGTKNIAIAFGATIEDVIGSDHDDRLAGNDSDNTLTGGDGADIFGFSANWGTDVITDFQRGIDELDFSGTGLSISDLTITSINGDTHITHGDDKITLVNVETIDATDLLMA